MTGRAWLKITLLLAGLLAASTTEAAQPAAAIRFGVTAVILTDQVAFLNAWAEYLEQRLQRPVVFVQRGSYAELTELLLNNQLDFAWVCGAPYVRHKSAMRLLVVPLDQGRPLYQSYLIVPMHDTRTRGFADLGGKVFAYSDPDSNSGHLVPRYDMLKMGINPSTYFRKTFFTWAHRDVVQAVADGLADAGAVEGYVWETLARRDPTLIAKTRVVRKSDWYGWPPIVARMSLPEAELAPMRNALLAMNSDAGGQRLLEDLNLDGFIAAKPALYASIEKINRFVADRYARAPELSP